MLTYYDKIYDFGDWLQAGRPKNEFVAISSAFRQPPLEVDELADRVRVDVATFGKMAWRRMQDYGGTPVDHVFDQKVKSAAQPIGQYRGCRVWFKWLNEGDEIAVFFYRLITYMVVE